LKIFSRAAGRRVGLGGRRGRRVSMLDVERGGRLS
jgi:hypothetical protein